MLLPWQRARAWAQEHVRGQTFGELLAWHLDHGVVYSDDRDFLLACEVELMPAERMGGMGVIGQMEVKVTDAPNCWFVTLAAGVGQMTGTRRLQDLLRIVPRWRDFAAWKRHGSDRLRIYKWGDLCRKAEGR